MRRSAGASFEIVTGNLVEESNGVPFEFFNGVNEKKRKVICESDLNDWSLNKFYIQKCEFEEKINENNIKGLVKWVFD